MSPANYVIHVFGGVRATARAIERSPSTVSKWRKPRTRGGTGGQIPTQIQPKILKVAAQLNLNITAEDLIHGGKPTKRGDK